MKKYICPMGCMEPQDQSGNCPECGMKLLPTDQFGLETDKFGSTTTDQFGFETDQFGYKMNKNPYESVPYQHKSVGPHKPVSDPYISVDPHESVPYPHKFVGTSYPCKSVHYPHKSVAEDFLKKFWISLILTLIVIFLTFYPYKSVLNPYLSVVLGSIVFFYGGWVFIIGALKEIKAKNPGMMTLIALAISSAYLYSLFITINSLYPHLSVLYPHKSAGAFWWELTSLITIMLLGHYFEMKSVSSAQRALKEIEKLLPDKAEIITTDKFGETDQFGSTTDQYGFINAADERGLDINNNQRLSALNQRLSVVPIHELKINDIVLVRPGGKIPADGVVIEGKSEVNESMITGESRPVLKEPGSEVIAGTINGDGILKIKVTKIGEETFLAGIKRLILEAQKSKSKLQVLADIFAKYLTFIAIFVGSLSFVIWLILQKDISFALERLVTVLVIACPHALGLAVPLVVAISTSLAVHHGFLIRNRLQLELSRKIDIVLFDKTGTLTSGRFKVKEILTTDQFGFETDKNGYKINKNPYKSVSNPHKSVVQIAASLNQFSQHFISQGILEKAKEEKIEILKVEDFENLPGKGVKGKINNKIYYLGGENLLKSFNLTPPKIETIGTTIYLIDENKNILGAIILEDEIREESFSAIKELHNLGVKTAMITGDKKEVAEKVAKELGIDEYFAEVLPQEKLEKVKELQKRNLKVMFVGDGINDAPALMQADVGVAIGAGTNVAIESAGIILVRNDPRDIVSLIKLSRATYRKMIENLFWASGYNIVAIPLAAGILAFKGILLSPAIAAIFMSLSTIIVAINALSLKNVGLN
jgi:Cu2+-exporting ATPase